MNNRSEVIEAIKCKGFGSRLGVMVRNGLSVPEKKRIWGVNKEDLETTYTVVQFSRCYGPL